MGTQVLAWIASFVLGIGVVWRFIQKYKGQVRRALKITEETAELIGEILDAMDDKKIEKSEIEAIADQINELQKALKGA